MNKIHVAITTAMYVTDCKMLGEIIAQFHC